jgi:hypothetical protein
MVFGLSNISELLQIRFVYPMNEGDEPPLHGVDGLYLRFSEI